MKIHNLSIQQVALGFNINYRALSDCCKKSWICNFGTCDN